MPTAQESERAEPIASDFEKAVKSNNIAIFKIFAQNFGNAL